MHVGLQACVFLFFVVLLACVLLVHRFALLGLEANVRT